MKKIISVFLTLAMLFTCFGMNVAFADEPGPASVSPDQALLVDEPGPSDPAVSVTGQYDDNGYYFLKIKFQNAPDQLDSLELGLEEDSMYELDRFDQFSYCDIYNKMKSEDGAKTIYVCLSKSTADTLYYKAAADGGDVISGSVTVPALKKAENGLDWTGYSAYSVGQDTEKIEMIRKNLSEADTITEASDVLEKYNALRNNAVSFNSSHGMAYRYPAVVLYESLAGNFDVDAAAAFEGEMQKTLFFTIFNDSLYFGEPLSATMNLLEKYDLAAAGHKSFRSLSDDQKLAAATALRLYNGYSTEERDEIGPFITLGGFYKMYDEVLSSVESASGTGLKGFQDGTAAVDVGKSKKIDVPAASGDEMVIFDTTNADRLKAGDGYETADGVIHGIQDGWAKIVCVKVSTAKGSEGEILSYDVIPLQAVDPSLPVAYSYRQEAGKIDMMMVVFPKPMDVTPVPPDGTPGDGSGIWSLDKLAASLKVGETSVDLASGQVEWITDQIAKVTFPETDIKEGETITLDFIDSVRLKEKDPLGSQLTLGDRLLVTAPTVADNIGPVGKIVTKTDSAEKLEVIFNELIPGELQTAVPSDALKKITLYGEDGTAMKEFTAADLEDLTWSQRDGRDVMTIHFPSALTVGKTDYFKIDYTGYIKDYSGNAIDSRPKAMPIGGGMNEPANSFTLGKGTMEILDGIREAAGGKTPKVAVTSSSDIGYQSCMDYFMSVKLQAAYGFALMGMEPVMGGITVDTYDNPEIIDQTVKSFEDCTGMFGPGGDQAMNTRSYLKDDGSDTEQMRGMRQIYYSGGVVSGSSAGDHSLSNPMLNGGESSEAIRYNRVEFSSADDWTAVSSDYVPLITPGFGFLKDYGLTDSHVNTRGRLGRIIVALKHIPEDAPLLTKVSGIQVTPGIEKGIGIGVDEDTALLVVGNTGRVLGTSGVMVSDISGANFPDTKMFTATNVRLSYLTSGDTYNFDTKAVTSSKPRAQETKMTLSPSEDIFPTSLADAVETGPEALMRDLIRSTAVSNYGEDSDNGDVVLTFKKDADTKGYYASDDAFTVSKMKLNITLAGSDPDPGDQGGTGGGKGGKGGGSTTAPTTPTTPTLPPTDGTAPTGIKSFADVKEADWFYDAVKYVQEKGLMNGIGDTAFGPHGTTTRGMIVTILYRLEGVPAVGTNGFTDVAAGKYYSDAAAWAAENKIVSGYGDGKFGPEDTITREQLATILMNYAKAKGYDVSARAELSTFSDAASVSGYAKDAMAWANAAGLIKGDGGKLIPGGNAERAQVAVILQRFMESIAK